MATRKKDSFEFKDRTYILKGGAPISYALNVRHSDKNPLQYFDPIKKINRSIRYATNQASPFEDEQEGYVTLGKCVLIDGKITVPKENIVLQKILSIFHPYKDVKYYEFDPSKAAEEDLETFNSEFKAMEAILNTPIEDLEAVARVLWKTKVSKMTSGEIKRDLIVYSKKNPEEIISLINDEDIKLRNLAIRAVEAGILLLKNDGRTFVYGSGKNEKVLDVEFGKNPYSELASFFKTDEGVDVMKHITNKI
tara:strand:+ start:771 stop:1523 length:753 start_codon:yes stop_codon:yes gene_type:complete